MSHELILILCLLGGVSLALFFWCISLHNRLLRVERDIEDERKRRAGLQLEFWSHVSDMQKA